MDKPSHSEFVTAIGILMQIPTSWHTVILKMNSQVHKHRRGIYWHAYVPIRAGAHVTTIIYQQYKSTCAVLSNVGCPVLITSSYIITQNARFFEKKKGPEHKTCVWILSTHLSEILFIPRTVRRQGIIIYVHRL